MTLNTDCASELIRNLTGNLVLVASQSGAVASIIEGPQELHRILALPDATLTVGDLWPLE